MPSSYIVPFMNIQDPLGKGKQWFVVHTQMRQELVALRHLQEQQFDAYLPRFKKTRHHARKVDEVLLPLFPRYLFVGIDLAVDRWRSINGTRGVAYLLTNDGQPLWVPNQVVEGLKAQEDETGLVSVGILDQFITGDRIRVKAGAFEGQVGVFTRWTDKARVELLLDILGRQTTVRLSAHVIEAA